MIPPVRKAANLDYLIRKELEAFREMDAPAQERKAGMTGRLMWKKVRQRILRTMEEA